MANGRSYQDRYEAGRVLAKRLARYKGSRDQLVLGLPRGGVPVAFQVAAALDAPLDVFIVRKLGVPGHEELAMGAIAIGGVRLLNEDVIRDLGVPPDVVARVTAQEEQELVRRQHLYRDELAPPHVQGRQVILIDDGLATGATMRVAIEALRRQGASRLIAAVPTAPPGVCEQLSRIVDEMVCALAPEPFYAVGLWYVNFRPTTDDEVRELLARSRDIVRRAGSAQNPEEQEAY